MDYCVYRYICLNKKRMHFKSVQISSWFVCFVYVEGYKVYSMFSMQFLYYYTDTWTQILCL